MKTADARLIAVSLIVLALSLPLSAWLNARKATAVSSPPPVSVGPKFQITTTTEGIVRLDTQTGDASRWNTLDNRWVSIVEH